MDLGEFLEDFEEDQAATRRRLAKEKSYRITEYLESVEEQLADNLQDETLVGSTAPEIFVGRGGYPDVAAGVLSPVDTTVDPTGYATSGQWYQEGLQLEQILQRRTGLLNSNRRTNVEVADAWDGMVGAQREIAIADRPVDIEIGLDGPPELDLQAGEVTTPTGPNATAQSVDLTENPHVSRPVKKTLEDDDWRAGGAMRYLYRRGFDVYEINNILSAGALGQTAQRRLVPTRWSITAVDDQIGRFLRGQIDTTTAIDQVEIWYNEYIGNRFWVVLAPGQWEFELVEMKAPQSVWNPDGDRYRVMVDREGWQGRDEYVDETSGAYYAARLGVLEALVDRGRQAKCLVLREVTDDYWAPVGVWQIREAVRNAFDEGQPATAESFASAVDQLLPHLPVDRTRLRRATTMISGQQARLDSF